MLLIGEVGGPAAWRAERVERPTVVLDTAQEAEVRAAAGLDSFPLPTLAPVLDRLADEIRNGVGFGLVEGLPVAGLTERQAEAVALGIAASVGTVVPQGPDGALVRHVRDEGADPALATTRSYQHSAGIGFHADPTDAVALLCIRPAM